VTTAIALSTLKVSTTGESDNSLSWSTPVLYQGTHKTIAVFRRVNSTPAKPGATQYDSSANGGEGDFVNSDPPVGWEDIPPNGNETLWMSYGRVNTTSGVIATIGTADWSTPKKFVDSVDNETIVLYQEVNSSAVNSTPKPATTKWSFDDQALVTIPNGWSTTTLTPSAANKVIVQSSATAISQQGGSGLSKSLAWSKPMLYTEGITVKTLMIFRRSASLPTTPSGSSYNFNGTLSDIVPWSKAIPSGNTQLWFTTATAVSGLSGAGVDYSLSWEDPAPYTKNVKTAIAEVFYYLRQDTQPATPTANTGSYSFDSALGSRVTAPSGWVAAAPAGSGKVWKSVATAVSTADGTGVDSTLTWEVPVVDNTYANSVLTEQLADNNVSALLTASQSGSPLISTNGSAINNCPVDFSAYPAAPTAIVQRSVILKLSRASGSGYVTVYPSYGSLAPIRVYIDTTQRDFQVMLKQNYPGPSNFQGITIDSDSTGIAWSLWSIKQIVTYLKK